MSCQETRKALELFVEGEGDLSAHQEHLAQCESCRQAQQAINELTSDLSAFFTGVTGPARTEAVVEQLRRTPKARRWHFWLVPLAVAAAIVLLAYSWLVPPGPVGRTSSPWAYHEAELRPDGTSDRDAAQLTVPTDVQLGQPAEVSAADIIPYRELYPKDPSLLTRLDAHLAETPARVHFQTDKPLYRPGEAVWFKCWFVAAQDFTRSSHPVIVEVVAPSGAVVAELPVYPEESAQGVWDLQPGMAGGRYLLRAQGQNDPTRQGSFLVSTYQPPHFKKELEFLADSYAAGDKLEAIVRLHRDTGDALADAELQISASIGGQSVYEATQRSNPDGSSLVRFNLPEELAGSEGRLTVRVTADGFSEAKSEAIPLALSDVLLALYPEGGVLLTGFPNQVYFQARDPSGAPIAIKGRLLVDGQPGDEVVTLDRGMGHFELLPRAGESYSLRVDEPAGVADLPLREAVAAGANLQLLENEPGGLALTSYSSASHADAWLIGNCRGQRLFSYRLDLESGENLIDVPIETEINGVCRVTLLTGNGVALAERLVYRDFGPQLRVEVVAERSSYNPREQVHLKLRSLDSDGQPVAAELALAVVDDAVLSYADDKRANLQARLLLESEVQGEIFEPNSYFDGDALDSEALDHLLNTQGWRSFGWEHILTEEIDIFARIRSLLDQQDLVAASRLLARAELSHPSQEAELRALFPSWFEQGPHYAFLHADSPVFVDGASTPIRAGTPLLFQQLGRTPYALWARVQFDNEGEAQDGWVLLNRLLPAGSLAPALASTITTGAEIRFFAAHAAFPGMLDDQDFAGMVEVRKTTADAFGLGKADDLIALLAPSPDPEAFAALAELDREEEELGRFLQGGEALAGRRSDEWGYWRQVRVFPSPDYSNAKNPELRTDFRETVYWNPGIQTDAQGEAEISFYLSDAVTSFKAQAEGISATGVPGNGSCLVSAKLPFHMSTKVPNAATDGDRVDLPLTLRNETEQPLSLQLSAAFGPGLRFEGEPVRQVQLAPGEGRTYYFPLRALAADAPQMVQFEARSDGLSDAFASEIRVFPRGFPAAGAQSGVLDAESAAEVRFELPENMVEGSLRCGAKFFPSPLSSLHEGLEGMLREPGGCFEQTTSNNYPNAVILAYLQENDLDQPETLARAHGMLERGYQRLTSYECSEHGFEWFGSGKGHEALTAFGLMQFVDMQRVGSDVDPELLERTAVWLKGRVNKRGGYQQNPRFLHTWSVDELMADCYITYGLAEAGYQDLEQERAHCLRVAAESDDPYQWALVANVLLLGGEREAADALLVRLARAQQIDGAFQGAEQSVVCSTGQALHVETTALALLALLRSGSYHGECGQAARWLNGARDAWGSWGSTQATVLALKALTAFASSQTGERADGTLVVRLNDADAQALAISRKAAAPVRLEGLETRLRNGENLLELSFDSAGELPYTLALEYRRVSPDSDPGCDVALDLSFDKDRIRMGETVRLHAEVRNVSDGGTSMALVRIGYPGGLGFQVEQLEDLKKRGRIDFFETSEREIILYLTALEKDESRSFDLDLIGMVPGSYGAEASSCYLYYRNTSKQWLQPLQLEIERP